MQSRCVDDLFLTCGLLSGITHTRDSLAEITQQSKSIEYLRYAEIVSMLRPISNAPVFTVVASFLGKRNYNRFEIEASLSQAIKQSTGWEFQSTELVDNRRADLTFRIHIADEAATIGLRCAAAPLHRRQYKVASIAGSLHPPVAYAMARLAEIPAHGTVLDPCCGAGTILIETGLVNPLASLIGGDIDQDSLKIATLNLSAATVHAALINSDAGRLPLSNNSIDRIVSNPAWGIAVKAQGELVQNMQNFLKEIARTLKFGGVAALLIDAELLKTINPAAFDLTVVKSLPLSISGRWGEILVIRKSY